MSGIRKGVAAIGSLALAATVYAAPLGTGFTYQGNLQNASGPVTDTCDFRFTMWDANAAGNQIGPTLTFDGAGGNPPAVVVAAGLFSVPVDFGPGSINGEGRWLRIEVICQSDPNYPTYATLSPRVELKPTPHALALPGLYTMENATSPNVVGGHAGNTIGAGVIGATISGGGDPNLSFVNRITANFGTVGGGYNNSVGAIEATIGGGISNVANGIVSTIAGGHSNMTSGLQSTVGGGFSCQATNQGATVGGGRGNLATNLWSTVGGGDNNQASAAESAVCGGLNNHASGSQAIVGGGSFNTASGVQSTIGGGMGGQATGTGATIGGGQVNFAMSQWSTVGGGDSNQAIGSHSTVAGGQGCAAVGNQSSVGGGGGNVAGGDFATISGGNANLASGFWSAVPGGSLNQAGGEYSLAAGRRAKVRDSTQTGDSNGDEGTFIWADSANADFLSTGPDQFLIRAAGGVGINSNAPTAALEIGGTPGVDGIRFPDGTLQTTAAGGGGNTLDQAYDQGGAGAGRIISADSGAVEIAGAGGLIVAGTIRSGSSITVDGTSGSERIVSSNDLELHVTMGRALRLETNATSPNVLGGFSGNSAGAGVVGATVAGGGQFVGPQSVTANFGTIGGGDGNTVSAVAATVAGGGGNTASALAATVVGGGSNTASGWAATVGGWQNVASGDFSTVGGGADNTASGLAATVGGGSNGNRAQGDQSTVGGGGSNVAAGLASTIGGGSFNATGAVAQEATVAGGRANTASQLYATVGGGRENLASGLWSTVPGGLLNQAGGDYSFAGGRRGKVRHPSEVGGGDLDGDEGAFVWADATNSDLVSVGPNQFLVRASGGMWFGTNSAPSIPAGRFLNTSTGGYLTTGGVWTDSSDRDAKENFEPIDPRETLVRLLDVPIRRWNFKAQPASVQHIGPTAQDFHAAFGTGEDDRHLAPLDTSGVALAAIQGLYQLSQEKECELEQLRLQNVELERHNAALERRNTAIESRLAALEARIGD